MNHKSRALSLPTLSLLAASLIACNSVTHVAPTTTSAHRELSGKIFGGEQPITGATIQLYAVNTATNGGASTALITSTVTSSDGSGQTNSNANAGNNNNQMDPGFFTITGDYTCPSPDALVYIAAIGGDPGAGTNNNQINLAALGACGNLSSSTNLIINEITTVGTVAALHTAMSGYDHIGSTGDLTAAFNTAAEYVNVGYGTAPGPALPTGYDASSNDIRALANAVQSCVNSTGGSANDGSSCGRLFLHSTPPSTNIAPTDTVQALIDIFNNPTSNVVNLFNDQPTQSAFAPTYASAPTDWSLPILPVPATPTLSLGTGTYYGTQTLTVSVANADANTKIYYTTDGSTPDTTSTLYSGSITLSASQEIQAVAAESSRLVSAAAIGDYDIEALTAPTVSLDNLSLTYGDTTTHTLIAHSTAAGSTVTVTPTSPVDGTFSSCVIDNSDQCTLQYTPSGTLAVGTYSNGLTASFSAVSNYTSGTATGSVLVTPTFTFNVLHAFDPSTDGSSSYASVLQAADGNFYGTTSAGGSSGNGTIYKRTLTGVFSVIHTFSSAATDGSAPEGSLIQGKDGYLYGTTTAGGANGYGNVFKIKPDGSAFTLVHSFNGNDGATPIVGVTFGTDGYLYCVTASDNNLGYGSVVRMLPDGSSVTVLHRNVLSSGVNIATPLVQATDGNFYGTASEGGSRGDGTFFQVKLPGTFTFLHTFYNSTNNAASPGGSIVQGSDGYIYGTTADGGSDLSGTVYKVKLDGSNFSLIHSFNPNTEGILPFGGLFLAGDGNFYGATTGSPTNIFAITPAGTYANLHSSAGAESTEGSSDFGLTQASDGNFYGTDRDNGANGGGTLFQLVPNPAIAAPITINSSFGVTAGQPTNVNVQVRNAFSQTMQSCFLSTTDALGNFQYLADYTVTDTNPANVTITAPATPGTYTLALTCGGQETGITTMFVSGGLSPSTRK